VGHKVNPISMRLGYIKNWRSRWFAKKNFADFLAEDFDIRKYVKKNFSAAGIAAIEIERANNKGQGHNIYGQARYNYRQEGCRYRPPAR